MSVWPNCLNTLRAAVAGAALVFCGVLRRLPMKWSHDPIHHAGVAYKNASLQQKFSSASAGRNLKESTNFNLKQNTDSNLKQHNSNLSTGNKSHNANLNTGNKSFNSNLNGNTRNLHANQSMGTRTSAAATRTRLIDRNSLSRSSAIRRTSIGTSKLLAAVRQRPAAGANNKSSWATRSI
jgi:hypothetical protein